MASRKCTDRITALIILGVGALLFFASVIVMAIFPAIYSARLHQNVAMVNGSLMFELLKDVPLPIYERFYFFNITNGDNFLKHKEKKLKVVEVGPYTYKSHWVKEEVIWFPNCTMAYRERKTYVFQPNMSVGTEDDIVNTLNAPLIMAADYLRNKGSFEKAGAAFVFFVLFGEKIIIQRSIDQLVYGGYKDRIIEYGKYLMPDIPYKTGIFAWMYGQNDTDDGVYTVFTGEDDLGKLGIIDRWNGARHLTFWKNDTCNMINGTAGEISPPLKDNQTDITIFQSFLCRSVTFSYLKDITVLGFEGKRFTLTEKVFGNESVNADNACFDTKPYLYSGVQDLSACQFGAPVILSLPHFYLADPIYLTAVEGLKPNKTLHSSYLDVMSLIGFSMDTAIRIQLNIDLRPVEDMYKFDKIQEGVFPVFWLEITASLTPSLADFIKGHMERPKMIAYSVLGAVMGVSVLLFIVGIIILLLSKKKKNEKPVVKHEDDPLLTGGTGVKGYYGVTGEKAEPEEKPLKHAEKSDDVWVKQDLLPSSGNLQVPTNVSINQREEKTDVSLLDS